MDISYTGQSVKLVWRYGNHDGEGFFEPEVYTWNMKDGLANDGTYYVQGATLDMSFSFDKKNYIQGLSIKGKVNVEEFQGDIDYTFQFNWFDGDLVTVKFAEFMTGESDDEEVGEIRYGSRACQSAELGWILVCLPDYAMIPLPFLLDCLGSTGITHLPTRYTNGGTTYDFEYRYDADDYVKQVVMTRNRSDVTTISFSYEE